MNENKHGRRKLPLANPNMGRRVTYVKPLTANRSLSFAVKWPNLDLKDCISWLRWYLKMSWTKKKIGQRSELIGILGRQQLRSLRSPIFFLFEPVFCLFPPLQNLVLGYAGASCKPEFCHEYANFWKAEFARANRDRLYPYPVGRTASKSFFKYKLYCNKKCYRN